MEEIQMTDLEAIMDTLKEAQALIESNEDFRGGSIVCDKLQSGEDRITYVNPYFQLTGVAPDKYLLSFTINNHRIEKVALATHLLTLMLYDDLALAEDNFVDINTNTVYYGEEAYNKYVDDVNRKHGVIECPVCEQLVSHDKGFEKRGYCKGCHKQVLPYVTYH